MSFDSPLSTQELEELNRFLMSDIVPHGTMDISMLDGFLTCVVIGPETLTPGEWLPAVWGGSPGPKFESMEQAEYIVSLIIRHMNAIAGQLEHAPQAFEPLFYERKVEGRTDVIADEWCDGFMQGVNLRPGSWLPLIEAGHTQWLAPMELFSGGGGWDKLEQSSDPEAERGKWVAKIVPCVFEIKRFWAEYARQAPQAPVSTVEEPPAGGDKPCPCGSGRKFKDCCGHLDRPLH